jgi:hypothetical protein
MNSTAIWALMRNDFRIYFSDRRALVVGILVPILIAAFFGYVFGGGGKKKSDGGTIPIALVDQDQSTVSRAIVSAIQQNTLVQVQTLDQATAETKLMRLPFCPKALASTQRVRFLVAKINLLSNFWSTRAKPPAHKSSKDYSRNMPCKKFLKNRSAVKVASRSLTIF